MSANLEQQIVAAEASAGQRRKLVKLGVIAVLVVAIVLMAVFVPAEKIKEWLHSVLAWADGLGLWGPVAVGAIYVAACVLFLPGSILTLGAGVLFGLVGGTITVSISSTVGACAAFLIGRTFAREWIAARIAKNRRFAAVDEAVGKQGFKIVLLTRLSPIFPFNMLNYAYGLTKVRFGTYALASWIGMLPGTVMYVYLGTLFGSLAKLAAGQERQKTVMEWVFFGVGLAVAVAVAVLVARVARKALKEAVVTDNPQESAATGGDA